MNSKEFPKGILFSKQMLSLLKCAAEGNIRPTLAGVYIKDGKAAVTNSYVLAEFPLQLPGQGTHDASDFPTIPKFEHASDDVVKEGFMIPRKLLENLKWNAKKVYKDFPVLEKKAIGNIIKEDDKIINFGIAGTDLDTNTILSGRPLQGKFPDYEPFFEGLKKGKKVGLQIQYLIDVLEVFKAHGLRDVVLYTNDDQTAPFLLTDNENKGARAIIMPLKLDL